MLDMRHISHMARAERFPVKLVLGITRETDDALTDWRRQQPDIPSRSEAIRRLIELGLKIARSIADEAEQKARRGVK
jgi:hypothetical protein